MALTALIVEDEGDLRLMTRMILESRPGYAVLEAESGAEALALLDRSEIDLILLDIRLPDMEGWEILERLTEQGRFPEMPVVMVSAHSTPSTAERAMREGVRAYVTKPFTSDELFDAIARALPAPG
ncbi:MAG: response regulator [Actinomycetota bacterium]